VIIANNSFQFRDLDILKCDNSNNFVLNLKTKLMKNSLVIITMLCFSLFLKAQNDTIYVSNSQEYFDTYENYLKGVSFKIGVGALIPQEGLKEYFGVSPMVDISINFPLKNRKSIDLTLQFAVPNQKDEFTYLRTIDTIQAKSTFMINAFLKFKKDIIKTNNTEVNIGLGIGMSHVTTNVRNPFYEGKEEDEEKYESITALLVSPGLELVEKFNNNDELTFGFGIQYSPYKIEGAVREDIGGLFYVPKIAYKF